MSENAQFEIDQDIESMSYVSANDIQQSEKLSLIKLIRKIKLVQSDKQAFYIMIGIGALSTLLSIFIIMNAFGIGQTQKITYRITPGAKTKLTNIKPAVRPAQK